MTLRRPQHDPKPAQNGPECPQDARNLTEGFQNCLKRLPTLLVVPAGLNFVGFSIYV